MRKIYGVGDGKVYLSFEKSGIEALKVFAREHQLNIDNITVTKNDCRLYSGTSTYITTL